MFNEQYAEIWYLWAGNIADMESAASYRRDVGAAISDPGRGDPMMDQIRDALAARAICALTIDAQRKRWKPVKLNDNSRDFLMPGGMCIHMRRECAATIDDVAAKVNSILERAGIDATKKYGNDCLSLTMSELEELLRP